MVPLQVSPRRQPQRLAAVQEHRGKRVKCARHINVTFDEVCERHAGAKRVINVFGHALGAQRGGGQWSTGAWPASRTVPTPAVLVEPHRDHPDHMTENIQVGSICRGFTDKHITHYRAVCHETVLHPRHILCRTTEWLGRESEPRRSERGNDSVVLDVVKDVPPVQPRKKS